MRLLAAGCWRRGGAAVLVSCGSSGKGLIPLANAGPAAERLRSGRAGRRRPATATAPRPTAAINKTEQDFAALPGLDRRGPDASGSTRDLEPARTRARAVRPAAHPTTTTHDDDAHDDDHDAHRRPRRRTTTTTPHDEPRRRRRRRHAHRRTTAAARRARRRRDSARRRRGAGKANTAAARAGAKANGNGAAARRRARRRSPEAGK